MQIVLFQDTAATGNFQGPQNWINSAQEVNYELQIVENGFNFYINEVYMQYVSSLAEVINKFFPQPSTRQHPQSNMNYLSFTMLYVIIWKLHTFLDGII